MYYFSSVEPIYYLLPIIGLIVGLLGTMLGGGGGFVFLPILTLLIGTPTQTAVITSLVAALPICMVGAGGHFRKGNVDVRIGMLFSIFGILGAFVGAAIAGWITPTQLKMAFGIYALLMAVNIYFDTLNKKRAELAKGDSGTPSPRPRFALGAIFGSLAGLITGTFGTSGTAPVLAGLFSMRLGLKIVIGTSLMIVLVNTFFAVGAHFLIGQIDLTLVIFLTSGSAIGAVIGPLLLSNSSRVNKSENSIRYGYAAVMAIIGVLMLVG